MVPADGDRARPERQSADRSLSESCGARSTATGRRRAPPGAAERTGPPPGAASGRAAPHESFPGTPMTTTHTTPDTTTGTSTDTSIETASDTARTYEVRTFGCQSNGP